MFKNFINKSDGASAVEFALISPIFVMLIIGVLDMGTMINDRIKVHNIAVSAAEYASYAADDSDLGTIVQEMHGSDFDNVSLTSSFECECASGAVSSCPLTCDDPDDYQRRYVVVSATKQFSPLFNYPTLYTEGVTFDSSVRRRVD